MGELRGLSLLTWRRRIHGLLGATPIPRDTEMCHRQVEELGFTSCRSQVTAAYPENCSVDGKDITQGSLIVNRHSLNAPFVEL